MVRAVLVDSQCDCAELLNVSPALLQVLLNPLDLFLKGSRCLRECGRFLGVLGTGEVYLMTEFAGCLHQFPHGFLSLFDFVNRTFHLVCSVPDSIISRSQPVSCSLCILCCLRPRIVPGRCLVVCGS